MKLYSLFLALLFCLSLTPLKAESTCNSQGTGGKVCCYCAYDSSAKDTCSRYQSYGECANDYHNRCRWQVAANTCISEFELACSQWFTTQGCAAAYAQPIASGVMGDAYGIISGQANGGFPTNVTCGYSHFTWYGHSTPLDAKQLGKISVVLANKTNSCQNTAVSEGCSTFGWVCDAAVGDRIASGVREAKASYSLPKNSSYNYIGNQAETDRNILIANAAWSYFYGAPCSYFGNESQITQGNYSSFIYAWPHPCTFDQGCSNDDRGETVNCRSGWTPYQQTCCPTGGTIVPYAWKPGSRCP